MTPDPPKTRAEGGWGYVGRRVGGVGVQDKVFSMAPSHFVNLPFRQLLEKTCGLYYKKF
jgi:hypothetical protein